MKYFLSVLGCQMNYSDAERISTVLENLGYIKAVDANSCNLLIFVTCSIRQKAEDRVYGQAGNLQKLKQKNPDLKIGITGCMVRKTSTQNSDQPKRDHLLRQLPVVDFVFRIEDLMQLPEILLESEVDLITREFSDANLSDYLKISAKHASKFQAFVPVQTGCDKFCTYCIVPFSRGREWSRPVEEIVEECQQLANNGCIEITLIGQTVNSYGLSSLDRKRGIFSYISKTPFSQLLEKINQISGLKRIRFSSPHPNHMTDDLIETLARLDKLCPYVHLPIQSGDDQVLKKMNRPYSVAQYKQIISKIRANIPGCAISTDIIIGFCGETEKQFQNTYNLYHEIAWDHSYLSRYSPRRGTFSGERLKDDIPREIKAERWHKLNDLLIEISYQKNRHFLGKKVNVLVESCKNNLLEGRSEHYKTVKFPGRSDQIGKIITVEITKIRDLHLEGIQAIITTNPPRRLKKAAPVIASAAPACEGVNSAMPWKDN